MMPGFYFALFFLFLLNLSFLLLSLLLLLLSSPFMPPPSSSLLSFYELNKASDTVAKLQESLQARCTVCRDGHFVEMPALSLVPGDLVILAAGSCVPADCRVNPEGKAGQNLIDVDESAMNGESLPKGKRERAECLMGTMVVRGECRGTVEKTGANTELGTTAALLRPDNESSNMQKLLVSVVTVLVVISVALCTIVLIYLTTAGNEDFTTALSFTVVVLIASIPMAVEIVTNTTLALGSAELSKEGAIVSRLSAIEDMASMSILCSDKTGTLTTNHMEIQDAFVAYREGETRHSLLRYCAMAARWNDPPRDALDKMVLEAVDMSSMEGVKQTEYMPFDPVQKRTEGAIAFDPKRPELGSFRTSKGAPKPILALCDSVPAELYSQFITDNETWGRAGIRSIAVARTNPAGRWELLGMLAFMDPPRVDARETIQKAREFGIAVKMITGDNYLIGREMCRLLDLGTMCRTADGLPVLDAQKNKPADLAKNHGDMCLATDAFTQVFPEHKFLIVECLRELGLKTGMTGDGVNDAPALKRADVGVAVLGATEAAQSAADIVLTRPGLSTIITGIVTARRIFVRIRNFLTYRIAATLQLLLFFFIAVFLFQPAAFQPIGSTWPPFFRMPVLMLMLITLLNDGTLIAIAYDNVVAQEMPERWNRSALFFISSVLSAVALASSLLLLWILLASWQADSALSALGIGNLSYGQITTAIYLKISISDFLTLFSARTGGDWFFSTAPAAGMGATLKPPPT
jgi:H+-transporting ATPase